MARITCFLQVVNVGIIPLFGLISFLISQFAIPSEILDIIEFDEIKSSLNSTPLMGIEVRDTNQNDKTALFGEYKGLIYDSKITRPLCYTPSSIYKKEKRTYIFSIAD